MDRKHIILTRFNLAVKFGCEKRSDSTVPAEMPWLDKEYLRKRFEIFEKYTFQSMKRQINGNFQWLVLFHKETPGEFLRKIDSYQKDLKQFAPVFLDDEQCSHLTEVIRGYLTEKYENCDIITTRIDNDDVVHPLFTDTIQNELKAGIFSENTIISYKNGLQYDIVTRDILRYDYWKNHFISLLCVSGGGEHILQYNHDTIDTLPVMKIRKETEIPLWVEIISDSNYSNAERWTFGAPFVSYKVKEWYPEFSYRWKSSAGYIFYVVNSVIRMFFSKTGNFCKMFLHN